MTKFAKTKFTGLLRGLLHRLDGSKGNEVETPRPDNTTAPVPVGTRGASAQSSQSQSTPVPAPTPARAANPDELELPLQPILASLPMDLRAKIVQSPLTGAVVAIPVEKVLSQLANGAVKITFGELRTAAPSFFVNSGGQFDSRPITLPLNEILTRLNPTLLSRRAVQKQVEVADDIAGPFAGRGQGITFTAAPLKNIPPTPPAPPAPSQSAPSSQTSFTPRWTSPAAKSKSQNGNGNNNGNNGNGVHTNGNGNNAPYAPILPSAARPTFSAASLQPTAPPAIPPSAAVPEELQLTISAPLPALSENWPDALKLEIVRSDLTRSHVVLPLNLIEPGLKRGRITFTWKNLRAFIRPAPPAVSVNDSLEVELPLKIITPLFFARQKTAGKTQPKLSVSREIPDLFFGFPQPHSPAQSSPPKPSSETQFRMQAQPEAVVPEVNRMISSMVPKPVDTNFYSLGSVAETAKTDEVEYKCPQTPATDFMSRQMTPKEVIANAMAMPGVAGVVIALPDGLRVANEVPADLNADTLAAFLPQIFERVSQSTRELRMGALNNVSFTVGNIPWKIFRVNAVYFAAFGRAGESLPTAPLAQLAAQLDRKKQ
jgi:predicted regulator of Ras-like GTPase activity (Roadblock/LC7/MglB family)